MAGKEIISGKKVKASTILEVIVSMVIIILVFGIAMMIYANVLRLSVSPQKIKAEAILQKQLIEAEHMKYPVNQTFHISDLSIEQQVAPYQDNKALMEIDLVAYDVNQQKISELNKVIIVQ